MKNQNVSNHIMIIDSCDIVRGWIVDELKRIECTEIVRDIELFWDNRTSVTLVELLEGALLAGGTSARIRRAHDKPR